MLPHDRRPKSSDEPDTLIHGKPRGRHPRWRARYLPDHIRERAARKRKGGKPTQQPPPSIDVSVSSESESESETESQLQAVDHWTLETDDEAPGVIDAETGLRLKAPVRNAAEAVSSSDDCSDDDSVAQSSNPSRVY